MQLSVECVPPTDEVQKLGLVNSPLDQPDGNKVPLDQPDGNKVLRSLILSEDLRGGNVYSLWAVILHKFSNTKKMLGKSNKTVSCQREHRQHHHIGYNFSRDETSTSHLKETVQCSPKTV